MTKNAAFINVQNLLAPSLHNAVTIKCAHSHSNGHIPDSPVFKG